jgi:hypothetical protein
VVRSFSADHFDTVRFLILLTVFELLQKGAILPYVLFLVTVAIFAGPMEPNEEFYRGSYIDASCQVWLHLAKQFQRRRFV